MKVKISGRLGNQMFQYATVKAFKKRYNINEEIEIDFSLNKVQEKNDGFEDSLQYFNINDYRVVNETKMNMEQNIIFSLYRLNRKIVNLDKRNYYDKNMKLQKRWQKILNKFGIYHYLYGYYDFKNSNSKNKIFEGYFESNKYFDNIRAELLRDFTPKQGELEHNKELYNIIKNTDSVCVTVRRGDFLNSNNKGRFYICTPEYFGEAIKKMCNIIDNPQFVVFSDDVEWCKDNMEFPEGTLYEKGNDPVWEKLRLMYSCKHFIISNSTFSWWAQYLSTNDKKIVIAPKKWSNEGEYWKDLYQKNWILM